MLVIRLFNPLSKYYIVFNLEEELLEIGLLVLLSLKKSNALAGKIKYTLDNFLEAVPFSSV